MNAPIRTENDLDQVGAIGTSTLYPDRLKILIGSASCGVAAGAREVEAAAVQTVEQLQLDATVSRTGCIGFCQREPIVDLVLPDGPRVSYGNVTPKKIRSLLESYAEQKDLKPETALCRFEGEQYVPTGRTHLYPGSTNGINRAIA